MPIRGPDCLPFDSSDRPRRACGTLWSTTRPDAVVGGLRRKICCNRSWAALVGSDAGGYAARVDPSFRRHLLWQSRTPVGIGFQRWRLTPSWGVPFDHLTGVGIDDFSSFSRPGGGAYSPLSVG